MGVGAGEYVCLSPTFSWLVGSRINLSFRLPLYLCNKGVSVSVDERTSRGLCVSLLLSTVIGLASLLPSFPPTSRPAALPTTTPMTYRGTKGLGVLLRGQGGDLQVLPHRRHQLGRTDDLHV